MKDRYTLQIEVGLKGSQKKVLSVSKKTPFTQSELRAAAHQYAIDNQLNPDTVSVNQLRDGKLMTEPNAHYVSSARVNAPKKDARGKEEVEIEVAKGAKVGSIDVKESFLKYLEEGINLNKLNGVTYVDVRNAFFANYLAALVMLKVQDIKGLMLINDHNHAKLTKFSSSMSDLNFWGRVLFYSDDSEIKQRMNAADAKLLARMSARVSAVRVQKTMRVPLTTPEAVNWHDVIASVLLLQHTFGLQSSYFNNILRTLYKWDSINISAKQKAINDALMFMMQSDPGSKLIPHLRRLSNLVMVNRLGSVSQRVIGFSRTGSIHETEDGGAVGTGAVATGGGNAILNPSGPNINSQSGHPDTSQDIQNALGGLYKLNKMAPNQITKKGRFTIRNGKLIKKRVKDFSPRRFKEPEFMKPKKEVNKAEETKDAV
jgi:hypothetical protein